MWQKLSKVEKYNFSSNLNRLILDVNLYVTTYHIFSETCHEIMDYTDYTGSSFIQQVPNTDNALKCQTACQLNPSCQFYSYTISSKMCLLKDIVGRKVPNPDKMSGPRTCPGYLLVNLLPPPPLPPQKKLTYKVMLLKLIKSIILSHVFELNETKNIYF